MPDSYSTLIKLVSQCAQGITSFLNAQETIKFINLRDNLLFKCKMEKKSLNNIWTYPLSRSIVFDSTSTRNHHGCASLFTRDLELRNSMQQRLSTPVKLAGPVKS